MTSFELQEQTILINSPADFPLWFYTQVGKNLNLIENGDAFTPASDTQVTEGTTFDPDLDGTMADPDAGGPATAVAITDVDAIQINGFKWYKKTQQKKVIKTRGINEQIQVGTLTITTPGTIQPGAVIFVRVTFYSWDEKAEYVTHNSDFVTTRTIAVTLQSGDTPTTIATRIVQNISDQGYKEGRQFPLKATSAAGVVTFTARDGFTAFSVKVGGSVDATFGGNVSDQIAAGLVAGVYATTTPNFAGRNNHANLRMIRPETPATVYAYAVGPDTKQRPISGALYTCFQITETIPIPGQYSGLNIPVTKEIKSYIYLNEATLQTQINALVGFFNASPAEKVDYPATAASVALANETPATTLSTN